jgi:hypothetical protein
MFLTVVVGWEAAWAQNLLLTAHDPTSHPKESHPIVNEIKVNKGRNPLGSKDGINCQDE